MKTPICKIETNLNSYYIEKVGDKKITLQEYRIMSKAVRTVNKATQNKSRWIFIQHNEKDYPVLLLKSKDSEIIIKAENKKLINKEVSETKGLDYWKRKILDALTVSKSIEEIFVPDGMIKSLDVESKQLLDQVILKARGYSIGTKRTWSGKEYKKVSGGKTGQGKWVRTYSETESRGAKQAIRNVTQKIENASSMAELLEIVKENKARFVDSDGKALPIIKEFLDAARGTEAGAKTKKEIKEIIKEESHSQEVPKETIVSELEAEDIIDNLNNTIKIPGVEFYLQEEEDETLFFAEVKRESSLENIEINPVDYQGKTDDEIRDMLGIKNTRGEDKTKRKERSDKGLEALYKRMGGRDVTRRAILRLRDKSTQNVIIGGSLLEDGIRTGNAKDIKDAQESLQNILAMMMDISGLNQSELLKELGISEKGEKPKIKVEKKQEEDVFIGGYDPTLDPNSEEYKYRDTGFIGGSRKDIASLQIKDLKKSGRTVITREINWTDLEENPREAESLILKSNLFGQVDWKKLENEGMEPGTGFLIDRIYASIAPKPEDDPIKRKDYSYGIESVRKRLEKIKTVEELSATLSEMKEEMTGYIFTAEETARMVLLKESNHALWEEKRILEEEDKKMYNEMQALRPSYKLERDIENRKKRGWKYEEQEAQLKTAQDAFKVKEKEWRDLLHKNRPIIDEKDHERRGIFQELENIQKQAMQNNYENNSTTRAWRALGDRFYNTVNYRASKGSDTFQNHMYRAKRGDIKDWGWAEKEIVRTGKVSEKSVQFQLQVSDSFERKGGKDVKVDGTIGLKEMFNLRDVESGNWVLKDPASAKFHIEKSAEAFSDLSDMTGIPRDKISFNGRLAMAYGARGSGGKGAALAHYEPMKRVINLTKMGGGGSLAHEWFHALDNLVKEVQGGVSTTEDMGTQGIPLTNPELKSAFDGLINSMTTGNQILRKEVVYTADDYKNAIYNIETRPSSLGRSIKNAGSIDKALETIDSMKIKKENYYNEMTSAQKKGDTYNEKKYRSAYRKAFKNYSDWEKVIAAYYGGDANGGTSDVIEKKGVSGYLIESKALEGKDKEYWSSPVEMAARAFSSYIEDKLEDSGRVSDYLSNGSNNARYAMFNQKPFPEGEERKNINNSMAKLFDVIKTQNIIQKALDSINY